MHSMFSPAMLAQTPNPKTKTKLEFAPTSKI